MAQTVQTHKVNKTDSAMLGIDIGGSGIKAAVVDVTRGKLLTERLRVDTPQPSTPANIGKAIKRIVVDLEWRGPLGCAFPAVIKHGVVKTASNVDRSWIGTNIEKLLTRVVGSKVSALNDADAAGIAETAYGRAAKQKGVVIVVTLGTGIGTALLVDGYLVPNTELGHLIIRGKGAERRASANARKKNELSWKKWGKNVNEYLQVLEVLLCPDLFLIGGGISKDFLRFRKYIQLNAPVQPCKLFNDAGIIGAAVAAHRRFRGGRQ